MINRYEVNKTLKNLEALLYAYGAALPNEVQDAINTREAIQQARAQAHTEHAALVAQVVGASDPAAAYNAALDALARHNAAESLNASNRLHNAVEDHVARAINRSVGEILTLVKKGVESDLKALTKNAPLLPEADPLDAQAIVKSADMGKAFLNVSQPLDRLDLLMNTLPMAGLVRGFLNVHAIRAMVLVDVPETSVSQLTDDNRALNDNREHLRFNEDIKAFTTLCAANVREALVRLARGEYPSLSLSYATDFAQIQQRAKNAETGRTIMRTPNRMFV